MLFMPPGEPSSLPHLTGLDVDRGLRLFGGQAAVYREALQDFVQLYENGLPGIAAYLDKPTDDNLTPAQREVHAVGGAGAALGATVIERLAQAFEGQVRGAAVTGAEHAALLAGLRHEVAVLVTALRAQLEGA